MTEKVWVLIRRYELEENCNQTESCETFVFRTKESAVHAAKKLLREDLREHGRGEWGPRTGAGLERDLSKRGDPRHLEPLSDSDNVVFELYERTVGIERRCSTAGDVVEALRLVPPGTPLRLRDGTGSVLGTGTVAVRYDGDACVDIGPGSDNGGGL